MNVCQIIPASNAKFNRGLPVGVPPTMISSQTFDHDFLTLGISRALTEQNGTIFKLFENFSNPFNTKKTQTKVGPNVKVIYRRGFITLGDFSRREMTDGNSFASIISVVVIGGIVGLDEGMEGWRKRRSETSP